MKKETIAELKDAGENAEKTKRSADGFSLLVVQSAACIAVILLALILRLVGGDTFAAVRSLLEKGLTEQTIVGDIFSVWNQTDGYEQSPTQDAVSLPNALSVGAQVYDAPQTDEKARETETTASASPSETDCKQVIAPPFCGGVITSRYGEREDPFDADSVDVHNGLDIAVSQGTSIAAMLDGVVAEVGYEENGYGWFVTVECENEVSYLYAHCEEIFVTQGEAVSAKQPIATVGSTGRSTGPHLHLEWMYGKERVDPETVVPEQTYA